LTSPETILKEISSSLQSSEKKPSKDYTAFRARIDSLKQLDPSLVTLFRVCDEILAYIDRNPQEHKVLESVASDMKSLNSKVSSNLKKIDSVQNGLSERIKRFDLLEAKYSRMITRVNGVLDELERVLRQF